MTARPFKKIRTAQDVRDTADRLGSHMFTPSTMRYWKSRLLSAFRSLPSPADTVNVERGLIVTSDADFDGGRVYVLRGWAVFPYEYQDKITFDTVSKHGSRAEAVRAMRDWTEHEPCRACSVFYVVSPHEPWQD